MELLDRARHRRGIRELNKGKTSGAPCIAIGGNKDFGYLSNFHEQSFQLAPGDVEVQVSDKNLVDNAPFLRVRGISADRAQCQMDRLSYPMLS